MKIIQMYESIIKQGTIGNDIEAIDSILRAQHDTYAYAITQKNPNLKYIKLDTLLQYIEDESTILIYHHSVNWEDGYHILKKARCKIVFRYHNITPARFFKNFDECAYNTCKIGRNLTLRLQDELPDAFWISDSEYNTRDLFRVPKDRSFVLAPFNKLETWGETQPDSKVLEELESTDVNLLFVGRVAPNKGHLMLLDILHQYIHVYKYGENIKLRIVGKIDKGSRYMDLLYAKIEEYGLTEHVEFIGEINDATLSAYYRGSDIMLCCSAHEGFCVPIVEAQYFGLPIIALRYCAVPETLGDEQLILGDDVGAFATAIHTLATNKEYSDYLARVGRRNYDTRFSYGTLEQKFMEIFEDITSEKSAVDKNANKISDEKLGRVAFVIPWFGENIPGGAEMELRGVTRHLHEAGLDVEILTTTVKENISDWNINYNIEGVEYIWNIPVVRFPIKKRNPELFNSIASKLVQNGTVSDVEEHQFCEEMVNSPELYEYIRVARDSYDFFVFIPYFFGTTYYGLQECYDKAVLLPCLHDEAYAYMNVLKKEFCKVAGMIFNAEPEYVLAQRLYDLSNVTTMVMGIGLDTDITYDERRFREKYGIEEPFLIYAGRKEAGKGVGELISYFISLKENATHLAPSDDVKKKIEDLKLVLIGGGSVDIPAEHARDIIDLGFVDTQYKYDACGAAVTLCQLSKFESFSLVIMESWLCDRPVIVHSDCKVTADFAHRFDGGYAIGDEKEFHFSVLELLSKPDEADRMGRNGHRQVVERFAWDTIVEKYIEFFKKLKAERRETRVDA